MEEYTASVYMYVMIHLQEFSINYQFNLKKSSKDRLDVFLLASADDETEVLHFDSGLWIMEVFLF